MAQSNLHLSPDQIAALPADERKAIYRQLAELAQRLQDAGPQTKQQLWEWIRDNLGLEITTKAVCKGHTAPMDVLWNLYSENVTSALIVANRGGSKTFIIALLHYLNSEFKPGCESLTFGATQRQGDRCYEHLLGWTSEIKEDPDSGSIKSVLKPSIAASNRGTSGSGGITRWKNGSKIEVVPGTEKAVNGPHPQKAHCDEAEQVDEGTWNESRNMAIAGRTKDGREIKAQDILTSTRKSARGRVQRLMNWIADSVKQGLKAPYELYIWCFVETTQQQPNCRTAPENAERLAAGDPTLCDCHLVAGPGRDEEGEVRTFDKTCDGRLYHSGGWRPLEEVQNTFQQNTKQTWMAQQECSKPSTEDNYVDWDESVHEIFDYEPDPANGPIYMSVDWGGTNPHAVNWYQQLRHTVFAKDQMGEKIALPEGSLICFGEIYKAEISSGKLAKEVMDKEAEWRSIYPDFKIEARFADPQGKADRLAFRENGMRTIWPVGTRDFEYMVSRVQDIMERGLFFCAADECPMFVMEVGGWQKNPKTGNEVQEDNHAMSNWRYAVSNIERLNRKAQHRVVRRVSKPKSAGVKVHHHKKGPIGYTSSRGSGHPLDEFGI